MSKFFFGAFFVFCSSDLFQWGCLTIKNNAQKEHYVNEDIKTLGFAPSKVVRVIGSEGEQLGLMQLSQAQNTAYDNGLDLVLIAQQADPPVCKIIDYGKFRFERDKKEKEAKKKQQVADIKEVQLSCRIDTNDFNTKANHARRFLTGGDKVKVLVRFKGRMMSHQEIGRELLDRFAAACEEVGSIDKAPILEGRSLVMFLAPLKASEKAAREKAKAAEAAEKAAEAPAEEA